MRNFVLVVLVVFGLAVAAEALDYLRVNVDKSGKPVAVVLTQKHKKTVLGENEYPVGTVFPQVDFKYWKKENGLWYEMSKAEKDVIDAELKAGATDFSKWSPKMEALMLVLCDELNISTNQMKTKLAGKIKKAKLKKSK